VEPGQYVLLTITDTGHGMDPATSSRIFEPFFTTKPKGKGTGLGLATVHSIVRQSGGYIRVASEIGRGTTFEIYLPVSDGRVSPPARLVTQDGRGSGTILLVDDEDGVRRFVQKALARAGYTVHVAASPVQAIEFVRHGLASIDLLLTDVLLPDMNGRALATRIQHDRPACRVLFMSGYTDQAIAHDGILGPGTAFIQKPFTPKELAGKVQEVLSAPRAAAVA
jgi:CheY-like chemotaxis protein